MYDSALDFPPPPLAVGDGDAAGPLPPTPSATLRRRIRGKQAMPNFGSPSSSSSASPHRVLPVNPEAAMIAVAEPVVDENDLDQPEGEDDDGAIVPLPTTIKELEKVSNSWRRTLSRWMKHELLVCRNNYTWRTQKLLKKQVKEMTPGERRSVVKLFLDKGCRLSRRYADVATAWAAGNLLDTAKPFLKEGSALLTWQGDFGVIAKESVLGDSWPSCSAVASILSRHIAIDPVKKGVESLMQDLLQRRSLSKFAWTIELCEKTYEDMKETALGGTDGEAADHFDFHYYTGKGVPKDPTVNLRVHVHAFVEFNRVETFQKAEDLQMCGASPWVNKTVMSKIGRTARRTYQGFWYCQVRKPGSIAFGANIIPFDNYLVDSVWVSNLFSQNKISLETAKACMIQCGKNVPQQLANLERIERERSRMEVQTQVENTWAVLRSKICKQKTIPEVESWLATFSETSFRYSFLVLEGPSRLGKTMYARSLVSDLTELLEVDCAGARTPDLSGFKQRQHKCVLCDEASVSMVLGNKKLFQAAPSWVTLASSQTNCFSYRVWPHAVRFVITSNRWTTELNQVPEDDRLWIEANAVLVRVTEPLWLQDELVQPLPLAQVDAAAVPVPHDAEFDEPPEFLELASD